MEVSQKELLISRILAGCLRCKVLTQEGETQNLVIKKPSLEQIYVAQELYQSHLHELQEYGCMSEDDIIQFMLKENLWSEQEQKELDEYIKHIEEFKVKLYQLTFKANEKRVIRKALAKAKTEVERLTLKRQYFNIISNTGSASLLRSKYLIGMSLYKLNGKPYFTEESFWKSDNYILDQVCDFYFKSRLDETKLRELARTEPWRSIWNTRKSEGKVFGIPSAELNDEQRSLVIWTGIYDSVFEHPECPSDEVIEDDDILDGWMIIQRRKRKADAEAQKNENIVENEKIRNSSEVFIPVDTMDDAKKIASLNNDHANMIRRQRLNQVKNRGVVHEAEMPDSQQEIIQQLNAKFMENAKGKG